MVADLELYQLSTADYTRMVDAGVLGGMRVELLDGYLVDASPQGPDHVRVIRELTTMLAARPELLHVQLPLETQDGWVPEPDLALAEVPARGQHATTACSPSRSP